MGSLKMKNVHRFDFSNLNNDTIGHGDEDDELSDDEVFYHDSHGNHCSEENGVHKPLMAPRHKSNLKEASKLHTRIRRVPSIRILKTPIGYFCLILAAIAGIISLILYLVNGFTFFTKQHSVMQTISFIPCSNVKVEDVWTHTFPMLGTESAFRLVDVNNDDTYDIIFGFSTGVASYHYPKITCDIYFDGIKECGGGVLALDGYTGKEIWRHYTENEIFALNCNADLDGDGTKDCIAAGRIATLVAISGQNGTRLWTFNDPEVKIERSNIYTPQYIHDVDGDGVGDLLVMHGGDPLKKPGSDRNLAARIIIMSSRTGKVIKWVKVPDGFESYYSPQLITQPDGNKNMQLMFDIMACSLWYIHLKDLLNGHTSMSHEIYRDDHKGIMTPPALVDITKDGIADIVMAMFNSSVIAFDGITFERIWNFTFSQSESYSTPGVGFFNDDDIADIIVNYQYGPGFPLYYYSQTNILDGKNGKPFFKNSLESLIGTQSSPLVIGMQGWGNDAFLYWQSNCHGFENQSTKFEFLKADMHQLQERPFAALTSEAPQRFRGETESLNSLQESNQSKTGEEASFRRTLACRNIFAQRLRNNKDLPAPEDRHIGDRAHRQQNFVIDIDLTIGTSIHRQTRVNLCLERYKSDSFYSQLYVTTRHIGQPGILIYDSDQRKDLEYNGNLNYTDIGLKYLKKHPRAKELYEKEMNQFFDMFDNEPDENEEKYMNFYEEMPSVTPADEKAYAPNSESQMNMQYPQFHNVRKHGRFGQDRNWNIRTKSVDDPREHVNPYIKQYPDGYPQESIYYPPYDRYQPNDGQQFMNHQPWKIPQRTYGKPKSRLYPQREFDPAYSYDKTRRQNINPSHRKWSSFEGNQRSRIRRHVGYHDGEGVQRIISTGTLAPAWNSTNNSSVDLIFATYWFRPQKALTILPEDKECIENKMKDESERFKLYKHMDHDEYEKKVTVDCLKKNGHYREGSDVLDEPPYDPFNISMGMMTVYRLRISCTCAEYFNNSTHHCASVLPWNQQGWSGYMGHFSNSYYVPRTNYL
ncbi:Protein FAM234B [Nymphon striatum]|nr:Protein FAM234B [Nymphon striatum]